MTAGKGSSRPCDPSVYKADTENGWMGHWVRQTYSELDKACSPGAVYTLERLTQHKDRSGSMCLDCQGKYRYQQRAN